MYTWMIQDAKGAVVVWKICMLRMEDKVGGYVRWVFLWGLEVGHFSSHSQEFFGLIGSKIQVFCSLRN